MNSPFQVIYLTGPPATGKSTLVSYLEATVEPLLSFTYSKILAAHVSAKASDPLTQDDMRRESARVIRPEDIVAVDGQLIHFVEENRMKSHIVIDSHAVTKESFGFRVTPFGVDKLIAVQPTMIVMLYAEAVVIQQRIAAESQGRPQVSDFEADFHTHLQASVAVNYSVHLGVPLYLLTAACRPRNWRGRSSAAWTPTTPSRQSVFFTDDEISSWVWYNS